MGASVIYALQPNTTKKANRVAFEVEVEPGVYAPLEALSLTLGGWKDRGQKVDMGPSWYEKAWHVESTIDPLSQLVIDKVFI